MFDSAKAEFYLACNKYHEPARADRVFLAAPQEAQQTWRPFRILSGLRAWMLSLRSIWTALPKPHSSRYESIDHWLTGASCASMSCPRIRGGDGWLLLWLG